MRRMIQCGALLIAAIAMGGGSSASAALIVSVQNTIAAAGSTGNSFEVSVANLATSPELIDSFAFQVQVSGSAITFTSTTNGTFNPYIFAADSLFGPQINTLSPGQSIDGSDISASGADYNLAGGATVAIGRVFYNVAAGPAATYTVSFAPVSATSFSDINGNAIPIAALAPGTITVTSLAPVPEPSSIFLMGLGVAGLVFAGCKRSKTEA